MSTRATTLEFAVLGLLHDVPLHGYVLRKRLNLMFGAFRALSYGSLYPCLKRLTDAGLIAEVTGGHEHCTHRTRIEYRLTDAGAESLARSLRQTGPESWDDDGFGIHFSFFARVDAHTRMRILAGRRTRLVERLAATDQVLNTLRERADDYAVVLHEHGRESLARDIGWIDEQMSAESAVTDGTTTTEIRRSTDGN